MADFTSGTAANKKFLKYDVFLNHRGDTKEKFVVPLLERLRGADIQPFLDNRSIKHSEDVFGTIDEAINTAFMHIAVFSKTYAESTYCLRELHQMLLTGRPIIIVFYDVAPEDLRRPRGPQRPYAKAFEKHLGRQNLDLEDVLNWEKALQKAAGIRGFIRANYSDDDELYTEIVKVARRLLSPDNLKVPSNWGQYDWKSHYKFPREGRGMVLFAADTNANVLVAFSPEARPSDLMYEIAIGERRKNKSVVIRNPSRGEVLCSASGLRDNKDGSPYHFWVNIDAETQLIHVGQGQNPCFADAIIIYKDPEFVSNVQYFSFSSYNAPINYTNIRVESTTHSQQSPLSHLNQNFAELNLQTIYQAETESEIFSEQTISVQPSHGRYDWSKYYIFQKAGRGIVTFAATAVSDVFIAVSTQAQTMDPMYEIVIGGCGNTESVIRRKSGGESLSRVRTAGVINSHGLSHFWISIDANTQLIHVGHGSIPNLESVLCIYKDVNFIKEAQCVSFSSWESPAIYSNIFVASPGPLVSSQLLEVPPNHASYTEWNEHRKLPQDGRGTVFFAAQTRTDVHVAISPEPQTCDSMYEVVIGGWNNSQSVIRKSSQGMNLCTTPGSKDPFIGPGWCRFWVSIDARTSMIKVGRGNQAELDSSVLCIYKDLNFITKARYVSFSSWDCPVTYSEIRIAPLHE